MQQYVNIKESWEKYKGFSIIALILGTLCLFFGWFRQGLGLFYLLNFFYHSLFIALLGIIYLLGYIFLIFYFVGNVLKNRGSFGTPMEKYSEEFFTSTIICFLAFQVLSFLYFIVFSHSFVTPPPIILNCPPPWCYYTPPPVEISLSFILSSILIGILLLDFLYERVTLKQHYENYLPEYIPQKYLKLKELEIA